MLRFLTQVTGWFSEDRRKSGAEFGVTGAMG